MFAISTHGLQMPDAQGFVANFQRKLGTTDINGQVAVTFNPGYPSKPVAMCTYEESAASPPVLFKIISWTQDANGNYTGVTFQAFRGQALPAVVPNVLALQNYNTFAGSSLSGITCHIYIADAT